MKNDPQANPTYCNKQRCIIIKTNSRRTRRENLHTYRIMTCTCLAQKQSTWSRVPGLIRHLVRIYVQKRQNNMSRQSLISYNSVLVNSKWAILQCWCPGRMYIAYLTNWELIQRNIHYWLHTSKTLSHNSVASFPK